MEQTKVALITGGSRGIGRAICIAMAKEGYNIAFNYVSGDETNPNVIQTKQLIEQTGVQSLAIRTNIASYQETQDMFQQVMDTYGRIDVLVNNAGITKDALLLKMKEEAFDEVIDVNLKGTWNCMKCVSRIMLKQKSGSILSMSSIVALNGNPGQVNYCASKAGIIGMTKALAKELGSRGITVNALAPGFIDTDMTQALNEEMKQQLIKQIPLGSLGNVEDIANATVFLTSPKARYITGQTIYVDGGMGM